MNPVPTILVIEDDAAIRQGLVDALEFHGYKTLQAVSARQGLDAALRAECDLVALDLVLPGGDGLDILVAVRKTRPALPIIILTARGGEHERVEGLKLGADDYVVKPFSVTELLARIEAVLRRTPARPGDVQRVTIPGGWVDLNRCEVRFDDGSRAELVERERELLRYLICNSGRAISRDELIANVWRLDPRGISTRTIDVHVAHLREKLRDENSPPSVILTVHGKGYMFAEGSAS